MIGLLINTLPTRGAPAFRRFVWRAGSPREPGTVAAYSLINTWAAGVAKINWSEGVV